jgi:hypothetical protein
MLFLLPKDQNGLNVMPPGTAVPSHSTVPHTSGPLPFGSVRCRLRTRATAAVENNDVDEIMCRLQGTSRQVEFVGFGSLPVWMGVAECRSGSREGYCVPRAHKKARLRGNDVGQATFSASATA